MFLFIIVSKNRIVKTKDVKYLNVKNICYFQFIFSKGSSLLNAVTKYHRLAGVGNTSFLFSCSGDWNLRLKYQQG